VYSAVFGDVRIELTKGFFLVRFQNRTGGGKMDQPPDIGKIYCPNKNCPDFSILGKDNIAPRGKYSKK
jgi:hypothetical protein